MENRRALWLLRSPLGKPADTLPNRCRRLVHLLDSRPFQVIYSEVKMGVFCICFLNIG